MKEKNCSNLIKINPTFGIEKSLVKEKMGSNKIFTKLQTWFLKIKYKEVLFLVLIFLAAFLFRRIGLKFGFPLLTHHDESISLNPVYGMTLERTLHSGDFRRPDKVLYFLNLIWLNLISLIKYGKFLNLTFPEHQLTFYFHARLLIAFMGALTPVVAYKIGKQFKPDFSIPTALLFAFFPVYVTHSHYATPDVPITLFTLIIILLCIRYVKEEQNKHIYLAVVLAALNTIEKYPGLLSFSIVIVALFLKVMDNSQEKIVVDFRQFWKYLSLLTGIFLITLYALGPNLFIEYGQTIDAITQEARTRHLGADNLGWAGNILFYLEQFVRESNPLILLFTLAGVIGLIRIKDKSGILLLYGFAYWIIMSKLGLHWVRWALPMYTAPLLLAGEGVAFLWHIPKKKILQYLLILLFLWAISQQMITSLANSARMGFTDTRLIALEYCNKNGITSNNAIYEGYTPLFPQFYKTIFDQDPDSQDETIKYVILSSNMYGRYLYEPDRYVDQVNYYLAIEQNHKLIKEFEPTLNPTDLQGKIEDIIYYFLRYFNINQEARYTGPTIKIFKIVE